MDHGGVTVWVSPRWLEFPVWTGADNPVLLSLENLVLSISVFIADIIYKKKRGLHRYFSVEVPQGWGWMGAELPLAVGQDGP